MGKNSETVTTGLREEVSLFAQLMEATLKANDYKGGWQEMSTFELVGRCREEFQELEDSLHELRMNKRGSLKKVVQEAVDVANFAMMIAEIAEKEREQPTPPSDGRRYRRLRILGCAPDGSRQLEQGTVLRFTNLDEFLDRSIASQSSLGEAVETCSATCPVCCNIEGATQHRPMTDAEAEHYETAPAAPVVAQREDEISKLVDAIVEIVHGCDPRKEETQLRTWLTRRLTNLATGKTYSEETK